MWYSPPASYYEPPEEPSYDRTEWRILDDEFFVAFTYDNDKTEWEVLSKSEIEATYEVIDEYKEDGLKEIEIYEAIQDYGICYGKHEDDYYEEETGDTYEGELLHSEKF